MNDRRIDVGRLVLAVALASTSVAACASKVGPYIRSITPRADGTIAVERCTTEVTDYGVTTTFENTGSDCSVAVLALPPPGGIGALSQAPPFPASGPAPAVGGPPTPAAPLPPDMAKPPVPSPVSASAPPAPAPPPPGPRPVDQKSCPADMAFLSGGNFAMGERKDRVKVANYCMDLTEVTADAYAACVRNGQCRADGLNCGPAATFGVAGKGEHPINCVDWNQASTYCQVQGKRLPSEEEWEWAARGGVQGKTFPWGNVEPTSQVCWSGTQQLTGTCQVGTYPPGASPQGIMDLAGNVWEWTASKKDVSSAERVARGGAWSSTAASYVRAAERYWTQPNYRFIYIGFRCAK